MGKDLIEELSNLKLKENALKRYLDTTFNQETRIKIFKDLQDIAKKIEQAKFKIQLEKELKKNEKNKGI